MHPSLRPRRLFVLADEQKNKFAEECVDWFLAELVCGTGSSGFQGGGRWSYEKAVVNRAAAFQRRCNDRERGRNMEPSLGN